ncbi:MAG TPA: phasin family protein [Candidatus Acidoferrales bacterium]|nr:phasin family protein [Candidatus Acidoferrales bacterium]
MAKRQARAKTGVTSQVLDRLQQNIRQLQRDAEAVVGRTSKQASQLITRDQKRALERMIGQAQRLRNDLEKRAQRASKDLESRAERFLGTLEKETTKRLVPLLRRLDLPSRQEVNTLVRRLGQLERRVRAAETTSSTASPAPAEKPETTE